MHELRGVTIGNFDGFNWKHALFGDTHMEGVCQVVCYVAPSQGDQPLDHLDQKE